MNLSGSQIAERLQAAGVQCFSWHISDRAYAMPTRNFITSAFSYALLAFQKFFGLLGWTEEANDCDDFARLAAAFAQILHFLTPGRPLGTALAVGEFWYLQDSGGGHAINVAICGHELSDVVFYEPQTRRVVNLTDNEKQSASLVRF